MAGPAINTTRLATNQLQNTGIYSFIVCWLLCALQIFRIDPVMDKLLFDWFAGDEIHLLLRIISDPLEWRMSRQIRFTHIL